TLGSAELAAPAQHELPDHGARRAARRDGARQLSGAVSARRAVLLAHGLARACSLPARCRREGAGIARTDGVPVHRLAPGLLRVAAPRSRLAGRGPPLPP